MTHNNNVAESEQWPGRLCEKLRIEFESQEARKEKWNSRQWHTKLLPRQRATCDELFRDFVADAHANGPDAVLDAVDRYTFACFDSAVAVEFSMHSTADFTDLSEKLHNALYWGARTMHDINRSTWGRKASTKLADKLGKIEDFFVKTFITGDKTDDSY